MHSWTAYACWGRCPNARVALLNSTSLIARARNRTAQLHWDLVPNVRVHPKGISSVRIVIWNSG